MADHRRWLVVVVAHAGQTAGNPWLPSSTTLAGCGSRDGIGAEPSASRNERELWLLQTSRKILRRHRPTPRPTLDRVLAPLIDALCAFATLTIWLDAAYAERAFEAAILMVSAVVVVVRGCASRSSWRLDGSDAVGPLQSIPGGSGLPL